ELVVVHRQGEDRGVEAAVAQARQQLVALFLDQQQLQVGIALADRRDHVRQQVGTERGEDAEADRPGLGPLAAPRGLLHLLDFRDRRARAFDYLHADRREHHLAWRAFDQRHAELVLELTQLGRQRRLADEAGRGRAAEVA